MSNSRLQTKLTNFLYESELVKRFIYYGTEVIIGRFPKIRHSKLATLEIQVRFAQEKSLMAHNTSREIQDISLSWQNLGGSVPI